MKLIIAGSRDLYLGVDFIDGAVENFKLEVTEEICGGATGVDQTGKLWAWNKNIPIGHFPANWEKYGNAAGPIRNRQMAEYADALLLIWDGKSKGSANMKKEMLALKKPVYEVILRKHETT